MTTDGLSKGYNSTRAHSVSYGTKSVRSRPPAVLAALKPPLRCSDERKDPDTALTALQKPGVADP